MTTASHSISSYNSLFQNKSLEAVQGQTSKNHSRKEGGSALGSVTALIPSKCHSWRHCARSFITSLISSGPKESRKNVYSVIASSYRMWFMRYVRHSMFTIDTDTDRNGQNKDIIAIDNRRSAGRVHWLIIPKRSPARRHIRDMEALTSDHLPLRTWCPAFALLMVRSS